MSAEDAAFIAHAREDVPALIADNRRLRAEVARWREVTGADSPDALVADVAALRARVRGTLTRGHLVCAVNDAGADRVEAARAVDHAPTSGPERAAAVARFNAAHAAEQTARATLAAFEQEHGLAVTCREQVP